MFTYRDSRLEDNLQTGPVPRSSLSRQSEDQTICGSPEKNLEKVEMEVVLSLYWEKPGPNVTTGAQQRGTGRREG